MKVDFNAKIFIFLMILLFDKYFGPKFFFTPIFNQSKVQKIEDVSFGESPDGCKQTVTVATIDTGIDLNNQKLKSIIKRDKSGNLVGKAFGSTSSIQDVHGHGTHIADLISRADHCIRIVPFSYYVAPELEIFLSTTESFDLALDAAISIHPDVINISGGGYGFSFKEYMMVKKAEELGITIVSAVGNDAKNVDEFYNQFFPGSYKTKNMISVGAITHDGSYFDRANYGKSVDIAALGKEVAATGLNNQIVVLSGTSQATAIVSGAVAKALLINRSLGASELKNLLLSSADKNPRLAKRVNSGRILNQNRLISAAINSVIGNKEFLPLKKKYSLAQLNR